MEPSSGTWALKSCTLLASSIDQEGRTRITPWGLGGGGGKHVHVPCSVFGRISCTIGNMQTLRSFGKYVLQTTCLNSLII